MERALHRRGPPALTLLPGKELSVPLVLDVMGDRRIEDNAFFLYLLGRHTGEVCEGSQQCKSLDILVVNHCS